VNYRQRYPKDRRRWTGDDYERPDLSGHKRNILADYDNATLYNDSIVDQIVKRFDNKEAVVIYLADHGEECFDDGYKYFGRDHSAEITARLAHQEFDVPFWIWCSHKYVMAHPDIFSEIIQARKRRMMTDALPHLLLYLAGIQSKDYHEEYNVLSPNYNEQRPRIIKAKVDYDKKMKDEKLKMKDEN
jgi:heptose-I-phosphate ethanolaminephosphotransferase